MNSDNAEFIQCANCGARNRIPVGRSRSQAKCGRCHEPLPLGSHQGPDKRYILRCSECGTKNRVNSSKLEEQPKCGKCGALLRTDALLEPQPIWITDYNFPERVLKSPLPVLVFAVSPTCPSCTMVAPHIDAFAREHTGRVKVGKLNIQQSPELASRFNILSVPYLLIFDRGNLMESLPGAMDKRQIQQLAARYFY